MFEYEDTPLGVRVTITNPGTEKTRHFNLDWLVRSIEEEPPEYKPEYTVCPFCQAHYRSDDPKHFRSDVKCPWCMGWGWRANEQTDNVLAVVHYYALKGNIEGLRRLRELILEGAVQFEINRRIRALEKGKESA